jgi:hypothetical protein
MLSPTLHGESFSGALCFWISFFAFSPSPFEAVASPHTDEILGLLKLLASAKKPLLLIEYPKTPERQALSKKLAKENGLVWLVTDRQLKTLGESLK